MTTPDGCRSFVRLATVRSGDARRGLGLALLLSALIAFPARSQDKPQDKPKSSEKPYALVFVNVFEPDGHAAYAVPVKIRRADQKKTLQEGMSDHSGEVAFRVPPGPTDYVVWADLKPAKKHDKPKSDKNMPAPAPAATSTEVRVHVENDERVDIGLHLTQ